MKEFKQLVLSKYGKIYGSLGEELQCAMVHWLKEHEGAAHTNTHTNPNRSNALQKINKIISWLRSQGYINRFSFRDWQLACINTVGADERTSKKYLKIAEALGRVKHYTAAIWEIV